MISSTVGPRQEEVTPSINLMIEQRRVVVVVVAVVVPVVAVAVVVKRIIRGETQASGNEVSGGGTEKGGSFNIVCYNCRETGHIARHCPKPRQVAEAAGRSRGSSE